MLFAEGSAVGEVTSGSYVPHLQRSIAMAYLPKNFTVPVGTELLVDLRGTKVPAKVVPLPFYTRPKVLNRREPHHERIRPACATPPRTSG